jgi:hypothetical protein
MIPYIVGKMTMLNKINVAWRARRDEALVVQIAGKPVRNFDRGMEGVS